MNRMRPTGYCKPEFEGVPHDCGPGCAEMEEIPENVVILHPVLSAEACSQNPEAVLALVAVTDHDEPLGEFFFDDAGRLWNSLSLGYKTIYYVWNPVEKDWESQTNEEEFEVG